ncbi:MAG: sigma 54-interacting transcriptional regulator [Bacillota bacterium]
MLFPLEGQLEVLYGSATETGVPVALVWPGECVVETALPAEEGVVYRVRARTEAVLLAVSVADLREVLALPEWSCSLWSALVRRLHEVQKRAGEVRRKEQAYGRLLTTRREVRHTDLAGQHPAIKQVRQAIATLASDDGPVYLVGEKGTGKELVAWLIHRQSARRDGPFVVVECGELVEDELGERLFGALYGPPTSGVPYRFGYLELAEGGTLLLKDLELLRPLVLVRLAAFLEDRFVDVRLMATSCEPVEAQTLVKELDAEILTSLLSSPLTLPPLRERKRDLPSITATMLERLARKHNRRPPVLTRDAQEKLLAHDYPRANVAELDEILERALLLTEEDTITAEHIFTGRVADTSGVALNLLQYPILGRAIARGWFPQMPQVVLTVGLWLFIAAAFIGQGNFIGSAVLVLAWSLGWPGLLLAASLAGRFTCSICPFAGSGLLTHRFTRPSCSVPHWLKKHDFLLMATLFAAIFWVEEMTDMRHSPVATGVLLLVIASGAVVFAVLYPRHAWCRYVCPLGGMVGVFGIVAPLELRPNVDVCRHRCTTYNCYKGTQEREGCPLFQHLSFIDNNIACKLCMRCVLNCPNEAVRLNLRPPAREVWRTEHVNRGLAILVPVLAALLVPVAAYERFGIAVVADPWQFSGLYWGAVLLAGAAGWAFLRPRLTGDEGLPAVRMLFALVPVVLAAHMAYQLQFVPYVGQFKLYLHRLVPYGPEKQVVLVSLLGLLRGAVLAFGFLFSLVCLYFTRQNTPSGRRGFLPAIFGLLALTYVAVMGLLLIER